MEIKTSLDIEYWTKFLESLDSDLKEKVKAFGIACLYVENHHCMVKPRTYEQVAVRDAFHELCEPKKETTP